MKKILLLLIVFTVCFFSMHAQTVYECSFTFPSQIDPISYKALFFATTDGKGSVRLRFTTSAGKDTSLVNMDIKEEELDLNSRCANNNIIYYKLVNAKYVESTDPGVKLPAYFCFKTDTANGLAEPLGVTNSSADCNATIEKFTSLTFIEPENLTKELALNYYKPYDLLYRNLFVTNNAKDLSIADRNIKLYLLFIANTTDSVIGKTDRKNMVDAIAFFSKIKDKLGINQFLYDTITGKNFARKNVELKLKTFLTPGPRDIVVFYYSGHGFRKKTDGREGGYIDLTLDYKNESYEKNAMSLEDITETIMSKGARLNLILSDACNTEVTGITPMADAIAGGKKGGLGDYWSEQNARTLFLNAKPATYMVAAASPTQFAISNSEFGGYFSTFFRNVLDGHISSLSKNKLTWESVLEQTQEEVKRKSRRTWCNKAKTTKCNEQRPYFKALYGGRMGMF